MKADSSPERRRASSSASSAGAGASVMDMTLAHSGRRGQVAVCNAWPSHPTEALDRHSPPSPGGLPMRFRLTAAAPLAAGAALFFAGGAQAHDVTHAVYTQTNSQDGNAVQVLTRGDDGRLTPARAGAAGGKGTSAGLGSQGAVALSGDGRVLLAVDAGTNDVAAFRVDRHGVTLAGRVPSRGKMPVSIAIHGHDAYVLNAGGFPN